MKLGQAIKLCRTQRNLKQEDLAELADISISYLSLLERGKRDPTYSTIKKIAEALRIPLSVLIFLASEDDELGNINRELAEKLSYTALKLVEESTHESSSL